MKTALTRIVLLACMVICFSALSASKSIFQCRCVKISKMVNPSQIVDIKVNEPSSYCSRKEVIVQLKDNISACLDPKAPFTIRLLKVWNEKMKNTIRSKTTTTTLTITSTTKSRTTSATVVQSL
ncbi:growth-regulated alpha protein-like [Anabas testudineus]|uniref:growth-regulated alpha protein-like n=1 Tax=Anabas testudineus TaxID=64144 RepID=UPI000E462930|nr:growth-regulated alpha protein-like [Anabas testudineus]